MRKRHRILLLCCMISLIVSACSGLTQESSTDESQTSADGTDTQEESTDTETETENAGNAEAKNADIWSIIPQANGYRMIRVLRYESDASAPTGERFSYEQRYIYDTKGNLTQEETYVEDGKLTERVLYENDGNGNPVRNNRTIWDDLDFHTEYTYDEQGNLIREELFEGKELCEREEYTYDERGNMLFRHRFTAGMGHSFEGYEYDEQNRRIQAANYSDNDGVMLPDSKYDVWIYEYDEQGRLISATSERNFSMRYEYDENGYLIEKREYDAEGKPEDDYTLYEYDADGNLVKKSRYYDDRISHWDEYFYE